MWLWNPKSKMEARPVSAGIEKINHRDEHERGKSRTSKVSHWLTGHLFSRRKGLTTARGRTPSGSGCRHTSRIKGQVLQLHSSYLSQQSIFICCIWTLGRTCQVPQKYETQFWLELHGIHRWIKFTSLQSSAPTAEHYCSIDKGHLYAVRMLSQQVLHTFC